jgi:hypothetical protein
VIWITQVINWSGDPPLIKHDSWISHTGQRWQQRGHFHLVSSYKNWTMLPFKPTCLPTPLVRETFLPQTHVSYGQGICHRDYTRAIRSPLAKHWPTPGSSVPSGVGDGSGNATKSFINQRGHRGRSDFLSKCGPGHRAQSSIFKVWCHSGSVCLVTVLFIPSAKSLLVCRESQLRPALLQEFCSFYEIMIRIGVAYSALCARHSGFTFSSNSHHSPGRSEGHRLSSEPLSTLLEARQPEHGRKRFKPSSVYLQSLDLLNS